MPVSCKDTYVLLDDLWEQCDRFPVSTNESTMLYNYNKLMNILQRKEIARIETNQDTVATAHMLASRFSDITRNIFVRGPGEENLTDYNDLDLQIDKSLSGTMYFFAKQWGLSVKALYYYKNKRYDKAFDLSLECIILNEYLIREGIFTLLFRAAEQIKNISRIFFRSGDWEAGASMTRHLLDYLLNGEPGSLYGTIFHDKKIWDEIPYVREGYAYECFRAMVSLMMHVEKGRENEMTGVFSRIFDKLTFDVNTPDRQIIYNWIVIKRLFQTGETDAFLAEFIDYMNEPISKLYDILKISLFLDVIKLVKSSRYPDEDRLLQKIDRYLEANLNFTEYLSKDISAKNLVFLDLSLPAENA